jgi:hypothetical protein
MSSSIILILRLIHVVLGVAWAGAVFFVALMLMPMLKALGPGSGPVMQQLAGKQKMPIYLMLLAILTVLSGGTLLWNNSHVMGSAWMHTGPGRTFSMGGGLAIVALIVGAAVNSPAGKRLATLAGEIAAGGGRPSPEQAAEIARLQARLNTATNVAAVLILLATTAMAVARYIP